MRLALLLSYTHISSVQFRIDSSNNKSHALHCICNI